ncbi:MAG TPA: lipoprotein-releasing ABC transporter permease subunit, partial [Coxiellaceae bacterium]|nr:lipoprotein-releasing ABC transporter permease subunit [Coxiellaceae bacterium]
MHRPLSLIIGLRYTRAKRRNHFISFISLISMLGIALGVAVLVTVLSVMNGFDYEIHHRFFAVAPQVTVIAQQDLSQRLPKLANELSEFPGVKALSPYINGKGMLSYEGEVAGVSIMGIDPNKEGNTSQLANKMLLGELNTLIAGKFNMLVGEQLALDLNLNVGDQVVLLTPQASRTPLGIMPRYKRFTVAGIFRIGNGFGFDNGLAYVNIEDAHRLFQGGQVVSGFHVSLNNLYQAAVVSADLQNTLPPPFVVTNWMEQFGAFFGALAMEKTMMFFILLLIIGVAAFNLVASLVMIVNDKQSEIAILRTMGTSKKQIMLIFIIQGGLIGVLGSLIGLGGGVLLAWNATTVVDFIQHLFHVQFISSSVYYVDYLPSRIELDDLVIIVFSALLMSLVATLYPAYKATRTEPAEVLRYE